MKQKFDSRWWVHHLPSLMVLVIALLVAAGFVRLARGSTGAKPQKTSATGDHSSPPPTQAQIDALKEQVGDLQSKADVLKSNEEDLKLVLELILGASGLFAIAQGIFAAFSSSSFIDQAERLISNAERQTERLISNAKEHLAAFTLLEARMKDADANRSNLRQSLASNSPIHDADEGFNWRRRLYEEFPVQTRQQILSTERFIPYPISGETDQRSDYERTLRYLAQFYWAKFVYERKLGLGQIEDLECAEYHLDLAIRRSGQSFFLLNDVGNIQIEHYKALSHPGKSGPEYESLLKRFKSRATHYFELSISAQKSQLRAYYNLAFIEADLAQTPQRDSIERAIEYLLDGLKYPDWERKPVPEYTCNAHYNVACYNGRLLAPKLLEEIEEGRRKVVALKLRQDCLDALKKTAEIGMISPTQIEEDFNLDSKDKKGDLYWFVHSETPLPQEELNQLRNELSRAYIA